MKSLFVVNVKLPNEYKDWINEITKTTILLITIHVLQYLTKDSKLNGAGLFNANFWKLVVFMIIGFSAYYLVVRKIVRFRYVGEDDTDEPDGGLSQRSFGVSPFTIVSNIREWIKNKL